MIDKKSYDELKKSFGHVSSWAIWSLPAERAKSNTGNMSVFKDENALINILNPNYVFVGLNASEVENKNIEPWSCFHSTSPRQNDYKLRYALMNTEYWGSYITDIIKEFPKTASGEVAKYIKKNPLVLEKNQKKFLDEISLLGKKPVLVAMGKQPFKYIKSFEALGYKVLQIPHYSYTEYNKENYREVVLSILNG